MRAEQCTEPVAYHGEGPVWDEATGHLLSVDMLDGDLLSLDLGSGTITKAHVGSVLACVRPRANGGYVCAVERGFALLAAAHAEPEPLPELWSNRGVRMNDGGCDPQGRFYSGSMAYDESPGKGTIWRLDPDGASTVVRREVSISNGMAWSLDGGTVYYIDSPTRALQAFAFDTTTGSFAERRTVVEFADESAVPDGMSIDAEGGLWIAFNGASEVRRYTPNGTLTERVELPVTQVTACAFGGPDLDTLFATTSRMNLDADAQPQAGAIFSVAPGVRGAPVLPYAG